VPAYRSVTVFFDPLRTDTEALRSDIEQACLIERTFEGGPSAAPLEIPVCYGGSRGPDLERVATFASLSTPEVIALHAGVTYRVFMLGFFPGFAYMGTVDPRIAAPRRESPRVKVPRGSVAIAGPQTGIYPSETPGGWQVIGQSPIRPFDLRRPEPFLFKAGDAVQFVPIDEDRFLQLAGAD
jgi:inhibitor of KinA